MRNIMFLVVGFLLISSCAPPSEAFQAAVQEQLQAEHEDVSVCESTNIGYGNRVYYFPCVGVDFGAALEIWLRNRPETSVEAMSGDGEGIDGENNGFFVVVASTTSP